MVRYEELRTLVKKDEQIIVGWIPETYQTDVLKRLKGSAEAVVKPYSSKETADVLQWAYRNNVPVTPRGAGTNLVGSTVPEQGGIVLDLSGMNRILEMDSETMTATVEPGVTLEQFQQYVEERGFFYPPDPGEKTATIGGNISTNAGGMRAVKYGVTRDYVMGMELVLADGRILNVGSKNIKDSTGLSLKNLIVGSEGTLAVITKCILKLLPKPEESKSIVVPYADLKMGIGSVLAIKNEGVEPTAIEFVERKVIELGERFLKLSFPYPEAAAYLLVTVDGRKEEVESQLKRLRKLVKEHGALDFLVLEGKEECRNVWKIRGALVKAVEAVSEQEPVDIVVPVNKTADFINYVNELEKETGMQFVSFGHAGDGNVHLCVVRGSLSEEEWLGKKKENMQKLYGKAYELGGLTSGEHGIGLSKKEFFFQEAEETNLELMRAIKKSFDLKLLLNRHISYNE